MDIGAIGMASTVQIGLYPLYRNEATETAQQVAANYITLQKMPLIVVQMAFQFRTTPVYAIAMVQISSSISGRLLRRQPACLSTSIEDVDEHGTASGNTSVCLNRLQFGPLQNDTPIVCESSFT
jgi:hypothetical protein